MPQPKKASRVASAVRSPCRRTSDWACRMPSSARQASLSMFLMFFLHSGHLFCLAMPGGQGSFALGFVPVAVRVVGAVLVVVRVVVVRCCARATSALTAKTAATMAGIAMRLCIWSSPYCTYLHRPEAQRRRARFRLDRGHARLDLRQ